MIAANHELADDQNHAHHDEHTEWLEHIARRREANQHALALMTCLRKRIVEHGEDLVIHEHAIVAHEQRLTRLEPGIDGIGKSDAGALLLGPTGLAFDAKRDILYVASTADDAIYAIPKAGERHQDAGTGSIVYQDNTHLHGPLALLLAPNGDFIVSNGDAVNQDTSHPSELTEFTPHGKFVAQFSIDPVIDGAFGIALTVRHGETIFAAVDDNNNMLDIWDLGNGAK